MHLACDEGSVHAPRFHQVTVLALLHQPAALYHAYVVRMYLRRSTHCMLRVLPSHARHTQVFLCLVMVTCTAMQDMLLATPLTTVDSRCAITRTVWFCGCMWQRGSDAVEFCAEGIPWNDTWINSSTEGSSAASATLSWWAAHDLLPT